MQGGMEWQRRWMSAFARLVYVIERGKKTVMAMRAQEEQERRRQLAQQISAPPATKVGFMLPVGHLSCYMRCVMRGTPGWRSIPCSPRRQHRLPTWCCSCRILVIAWYGVLQSILPQGRWTPLLSLSKGDVFPICSVDCCMLHHGV